MLKSFILSRLGPAGVQTLRGVRRWYRTARRIVQTAVGPSVLVQQLANAGIRRGQVLVVHASLARLGNIRGGASAVVTALMDAVGPEGTILMPSYVGQDAAFRASNAGAPIDLRVAPGRQGAVAEAFRQHPDVVRSSHPFSSMCAWGARAAEVTSGHEHDPRICHESSPLGRLPALDALVVGLGIDMGPVSFYHVAEDADETFPVCPYGPPIPIAYIDAQGRSIRRLVRGYDPSFSERRIDGVHQAWMRDAMGHYLDAHGERRTFAFGNGRAWAISARRFLACLQDLAREDVTIYSTREDWSRVR